jgi:alkanesulfonate monooxygenase SsuD/methylene tetrahydromethanopterin reductase-like flavin-dependent oxidoreductase (luciferase family)
LRLGVITLQLAPWPELVERWRRLDELGVETIWVADHLTGTWLKPGQPWYEAWTCVTALAHVTERARFGTLVSSMTLRDPAVLARTALGVADLSGGRLELGVGSGGSDADQKLADVPSWSPRERATRFVGWVERLAAFLADERFSPRPDVPLTIAGRGETILGLAARFADRWNTYGGVGIDPEEGLRRGREDNARLDELCAETGRTVLRSALIGHPFVGETPFRSDGAWADFVGRWEEVGFEELVLYYPPETGMPEGSVTPGVFERAFARQG